MNKALIFALAAAALTSGCNQGRPTPDKTVQQLMAEDVQPTAEIFWNSVQYISDETGEHDIYPRTDADWQKTRDAATRMIALAELLQTPGYAEGRGENWVEISRSLADVGRLAEQAADAKDVEKVFEVGGTMYSVCSACHLAFPPEEGLPPDAAAEAPAT
jgi:hypothetical protein